MISISDVLTFCRMYSRNVATHAISLSGIITASRVHAKAIGIILLLRIKLSSIPHGFFALEFWNWRSVMESYQA